MRALGDHRELRAFEEGDVIVLRKISHGKNMGIVDQRLTRAELQALAAAFPVDSASRSVAP